MENQLEREQEYVVNKLRKQLAQVRSQILVFVVDFSLGFGFIYCSDSFFCFDCDFDSDSDFDVGFNFLLTITLLDL